MTGALRLLVGMLGNADAALALLLFRLHTHAAFPCSAEPADGEVFDCPAYMHEVKKWISQTLQNADRLERRLRQSVCEI